MGGEVVLKLPFILGHVDATTAASATSAAISEKCTRPSCRGVDQRDRWATTRIDDDPTDGAHDNITSTNEAEGESCKDNDEDDDQTRQQSQSTDDSHRTTSVEDFIVQQENTAAASWKLTTMDECGDMEETPETTSRKDTVRQSTITTTLARANATDISDEASNKDHAVTVTPTGRQSSMGQRPPVASNNTNNINGTVITAQIHI